jgi:outer membrane lipoprotein-sorting protein
VRAVFSILFLVVINAGFSQSAKEIIEKSDEKMRGNTSQATLLIRTLRPTWSREMRVKTWEKGRVYSMIYVEAPQKDKGIVFLKRKNEVWNWIPSIEKVIKLPPSMMSQSWMGTDFSNDDLVKESSIVSDYTHGFSGDTVISNRHCYLITLTPKPEAAVVWGRLVVAIDKKDLVELHVRFYDEDGVLVSTMNGYDVKIMDGRMIPTRIEMIPADKKGQRTEMIYERISFNKPIADGFFTTEQMKLVN